VILRAADPIVVIKRPRLFVACEPSRRGRRSGHGGTAAHGAKAGGAARRFPARPRLRADKTSRCAPMRHVCADFGRERAIQTPLFA
jgi:hypothetical protein